MKYTTSHRPSAVGGVVFFRRSDLVRMFRQQGRFGTWTFRHQGRFGTWTFRPLGRFGTWTFQPLDVLAPGHFGPKDVSARGRFGPKDVSAPGHFGPQTFRLLDISAPGHFGPQRFSLPKLFEHRFFWSIGNFVHASVLVSISIFFGLCVDHTSG